MIEKHFTLDRSSSGPDHRASLEPDELRHLVVAVRRVGLALGDGIKRPVAGEAETREVARRSLVAARDLEAGRLLCAGDLVAKRPGTGISPFELESVTGRRLRTPVRVDELLSWDQLA